MAEPEGPGRAGASRRRLAAVLALDPAAEAIEFGSRWYPWSDVAATADTIADALRRLELPVGAPVGVVLRNRPAPVGALVGVVLAGGCVVVVNPMLGAERVGADLANLRLPLLVGERNDLERLVPAGQESVLSRLSLGDLGAPAHLDVAPRRDHTVVARPGVAIRLLTSGTTGPPKRVDLTHDTLDRVLRGAKHYEGSARDDVRLREGVVIVSSPMVHLGGLFRVLQAFCDGRRIALLERFTVDDWLDRVRRHRPKTASLVPTALRMVLDADPDPADLGSLRSVVSGTAPLDPDLADRFTSRFGVPVLTNYAATEFGGAVAGWTVADHDRWWAKKRGSVGRAHPGTELRVVDRTTGEPVAPGEVGLLEVRAEQLPDADWVRTTDLAHLDEDGFLWIVGRADQTIIRGGLKVQPETVQRVLEGHPTVRGAAVVGLDDERLGQVPIAVVELADGAAVDETALLAYASERLARYELPVRVLFVDALPRAATAKVELGAVRSLAASVLARDGAG